MGADRIGSRGGIVHFPPVHVFVDRINPAAFPER